MHTFAGKMLIGFGLVLIALTVVASPPQLLAGGPGGGEAKVCNGPAACGGCVATPIPGQCSGGCPTEMPACEACTCMFTGLNGCGCR